MQLMYIQTPKKGARLLLVFSLIGVYKNCKYFILKMLWKKDCQVGNAWSFWKTRIGYKFPFTESISMIFEPIERSR